MKKTSHKPRERKTCTTCGLKLHLRPLPDGGVKWCHSPGNRSRHDRCVIAAEGRRLKQELAEG